jgi:hypothetical protein
MALLPTALLAGCSTHPLPQDFSRKTTVDIVKKMRCEISDGINRLSAASEVELEGTMIGFDFVLKMTEDNDATAGKISLLDPLSRGQFTLDITGSAEKTRHNERRFRMVDNMLKLRQESGCSAEDQRANFIYPIAGKVGLDEIVSTYWRLKDISKFDAYSDEGKKAFIDKLLFTTTLSAGLSPNIKIDSGAASLHLTNASINGSVVRKDEHQVTIAVVQYVEQTVVTQRPPKSGQQTDRSGGPGASAQERPQSRGERTTVRASDPAAAARAVNRALDQESIRDDLRDYGPFFRRGLD